MPRTSFASVSTARVPVGTPEDLQESLLWFHALLPKTAREELARAQRGGSLPEPVHFVDGKKGRDIDAVKPFGNITYADSIGPLREAIAMAHEFVTRGAPRASGHYAESLEWLANGQMVMGLPDAERVGARGNVQLVDLAPYASRLEIEMPRALIYGAFLLISRRFGRQLSVSYGYANPERFGGLRARPGNPPRVPYAVPVLTMGNPASTVRPGARARPGVHAQRLARILRRQRAENNKGSGGGNV